MNAVINSDQDAVEAALRMARECHYFITGEVRGAAEIRAGHRLACPLVNEPFWIIELVREPPPVTPRNKVHLTGVSDYLILLVTQKGGVFHWPNDDKDFEQIFSRTYIAGSSSLELVPGRAQKISKNEWRQICIDADRGIERLLEEYCREQREKREKAKELEDALREIPPEDVFELPTMEEIEEAIRQVKAGKEP